jgi:hypothetical protein
MERKKEGVCDCYRQNERKNELVTSTVGRNIYRKGKRETESKVGESFLLLAGDVRENMAYRLLHYLKHFYLPHYKPTV